MAFNETTTIDYTPEQVFEALTSRDFHTQASDTLRADLDEFSVVPSNPAPDDTVSVNIQRTVNGEDFAAKLPSAVQRFAKGRVSIVQEEAWSAAAQDGSRDADITITVDIARATATAKMQIFPAKGGSATVVETEGTVDSSIPLIGSKVARMAEPQVGKLLTSLTTQIESWLQKQ